MLPLALLSVVLAVSAGEPQIFGGYLPPPLNKGYIPPAPSNHYLPPAGVGGIGGGGGGNLLLPAAVPPPPKQQRQPQPAANTPQKVIFFEEAHYANKASEPGFCHTFCSSQRNTVVQKPGRCPTPLPGPPRGLCKNECTYDSECPGNERCCYDGCASVCVRPDLRLTCSDISCDGANSVCVEHAGRDAECVNTTPKPGYCPNVSIDSLPRGGCHDSCRYDAECDGDAKCCSNGCALKCLTPRKAGCAETKCKVGYKCEEDAAGTPQCKPIPCEQDGEVLDIECNSCTCIQGFLLCAQEECPPTKPGFCPRHVKGYKGRCVEECDSDYDCENDSKCCTTGCGHTCQKPGKAIVHPCKTVRFRCGDDTRCAATRGLCQPGKPCPLSPLCVSNRVPYCESCPVGKVCVLQKKACFGSGRCHRQPICIQLYSDDTPFEENEELEVAVVAKQQAARERVNSIFE